MPPLPVLYGVLNLMDSTTAVMSEKANTPHQGVRLGEQIGEFTLVSVNRDEITFEWDGKPVTKRIDEMLVREPAPAAPASNTMQQFAPDKPARMPLPEPMLETGFVPVSRGIHHPLERFQGDTRNPWLPHRSGPLAGGNRYRNLNAAPVQRGSGRKGESDDAKDFCRFVYRRRDGGCGRPD
jgi:hypothetical protein